MPTTPTDLAGIADVIQEVITELEAAADQLSKKQDGRHAARCVNTIQFNQAQLQDVLPRLRDLLRGDRGPVPQGSRIPVIEVVANHGE